MNINPAIMSQAAGAASDLLKALGNPNRLMLLCQMIDGERPVGELAAALGIRDTTVSQHLALLRKDGIVATRRQGQTIYYSIASDEARAVITTLYELFCVPLCIKADSAQKNSREEAPSNE